MKTITLETRILEFDTGELEITHQLLFREASLAARKAYAPYSGFQVGAAVLLADGRIVTGNNQENAAYPSGLCAERIALFSAGALYPEVPVKALAVCALKKGEFTENISLCGSCRQVLLESEHRYGNPVTILLCGSERVLVIEGARSLLPLSFTQDTL